MTEEHFTSKFYISKKDEKEACFRLNLEVKAYKRDERYFKVEIYATICYQYLKVGDTIRNKGMKNQVWQLKCNGSRWDFRSSIMINGEYRSLGIGTFLINKMLSIALDYVPTASLSGTLSAVDEEETENHKRRDKLYKNLGFKFYDDNTGFSIEKISDLKIRKEFDYIQDICIVDELCRLKYLECEKGSFDKCLGCYKDELREANNKVSCREKIIKIMFVFMVLILFICFY